MGVEIPRVKPIEPPRCWTGIPSVREAEDHWYDSSTGHPLSVVRLCDGAPMTRLRIGSPLYCDNQVVSVARYQRFLSSNRASPLPGESISPALRSRQPMTGVSFHEATRFARWAQGFIADSVLWKGVARISGDLRQETRETRTASFLNEIVAPYEATRSPEVHRELAPDDSWKSLRLDFSGWTFEWTQSSVSSEGWVAQADSSQPAALDSPLRQVISTRWTEETQGRRVGYRENLTSWAVGFRLMMKIDPTGRFTLRLGGKGGPVRGNG